MVRKLVEGGADVMVETRSGESVLFAASAGGHVDVVAYLLGLGVFDVAAEGAGYSSSLWAACVRNHPEVVKLLIEGGADVDVEGRERNGPLCVACEGGHVECVQLLVDAGACSGVVGE